MNPHLPMAIRKAFRGSSILRTRDLEAHGIWRTTLGRLVNEGTLVREERGVYRLPDGELGENHSLAQVAKRVPHGVVCLLSALQFHGLTTQHPPEVWVAIEGKARAPKIVYPPVRLIRPSGEAFYEGQEKHRIEGVSVSIYNPAKTVTDCFKYRNKVGLDVALEALRETWRNKRASIDELLRYARTGRVEKVMRPYLESLT